MGRERREKLFLWIALFGWPLAVAVGWLIDHLTAGRVPMAIFPVLWLLSMAGIIVLLRRRANPPVASRKNR